MYDHCEYCGAYAPLRRIRGIYLCPTCQRQHTSHERVGTRR